MSIFSEVGKIIMETAEQEDNTVSEEELTDIEETPPIPVSLPEIDGEIVMDGEDMLRVVHVNSPAPPVLPDTTAPETAFIEDDLSFWENSPEPVAVPEPVVLPEPPAAPKTNSRKRTAAAAKAEAAALPEAEPAAEPKLQPLSAEETPRNAAAAITGDVITGDVIFPADAAVCADITGNVTAKGVLTMEGSVTGNVEAQEVILRGAIRGSVKCGKLTLLPVRPGGAMSSIQGSITAESLFTEFT